MSRAVDLELELRVRRRWLLTLATKVVRFHKGLAREMARRTVVEYRVKGAPKWSRIDMKEALR